MSKKILKTTKRMPIRIGNVMWLLTIASFYEDEINHQMYAHGLPKAASLVPQSASYICQ